MTTRDEAMKTKPTLKASSINKDTTRHPAFDEHFSIADTVDKEHSFWCSKTVFLFNIQINLYNISKKIYSLCVCPCKNREKISKF